MRLDNKQLVVNFFNSNYYKQSSEFEQYIHPEIKMEWRSSHGLFYYDYDKFKTMSMEMGKSFSKITPEFYELIAEDEKVFARFTLNIENLDSDDWEELAHFYSIWEVKDNQLYRACIMSQPADNNFSGINSFINQP